MEEKFLKFVADVFEMDAKDLSLDTEYESVPAWDSLMMLRLVAEIGEEYNVDIPIDEVPGIKKLSDFFKYIQN